MNDITHRAFFGDADHEFRLTAPLLLELEATTGAGIGGLFRRMIANDFRSKEISETIRLGLIGGGETPENAARLVQTYVEATPLLNSYSLALSILEARMFGRAKTVEDALMNEEAVMSAVLKGEGA